MVDQEQLIQVTTKGDLRQYEATWVGDQSGQIIDRLNQRVGGQDAGQLGRGEQDTGLHLARCSAP